MNILDFIILGLITFFVIKGFFKGFFREISSLIGIVFGLLIANQYYPSMTAFIKGYVQLEKYLPLISFVLLFISVLIFFIMLGVFLQFVFKKLFIGWLDKGLGVGLALVKGIIVAYMLIVMITFFMPSKSPLITKSKTAHMVTVTYQSMVQLISPVLYREWKKKISNESKKIGKIISEGKKADKNIPQVLPDKKN
jgi:membrane protein required for colicin V production